MARRALRRHVPDFSRERVIVSIIGDFVSDEVRAEGLYERDILLFLRERVLNKSRAADEAALDVGANIGNHSMFLADVFKRVIAFEPNPLARSLLVTNLELNGVGNVEVHALGLSDHSANAELRFDPVNLGAARLNVDKAPSARRAEIELMIGDEAVERDVRVGFIKVDVEGAEDAVLRGLKQTLCTHKPIVMLEQLPDAIDESGGSRSLTLLRELGYSVWEIQKARLFRGQLGKIPTLLLGRIDQYLTPVTRLHKREYPALICTPEGFEFPGSN
jgi:FkbM family methyltransferase